MAASSAPKDGLLGAVQGDVATVRQISADDPDGALSADRAAMIDRLYRDHLTPLVRYVARRFGAGPPEPEDVAQAVFFKIADQQAVIEKPERYLRTVACNIVIDYHRRESHRSAVDGDIARADAESMAEFSLERVLLAKERLAIFDRAVKAMPVKRRRIFLMVHVEGRSRAEVARLFGVTQNAVNQHVARALADCALALQKADRRSMNFR